MNRSEALEACPELSGADLSGANLSGADLYGANLYGANLSCTSWCGACVDGMYLGHGISGPGVYLWALTPEEQTQIRKGRNADN